MLLKIENVEEIGRFAQLKHKAPQFNRLSLVFARNGYGKSTICSILRSATTLDAGHITTRRRLDAQKPSAVRLDWPSKATFSFTGNGWSACPGKIYVFDQDFVLKNLHVGESVTRDNKRSLLPVVMGDQGVVLAEKILALDREQREVNEKLSVAARIIQAKLPAVSAAKIGDFCRKAVPADIAARTGEAAKKVELAKHAKTIQLKPNPLKLSVGTLNVHQNTLMRTISEVSEDATTRVKAQIDNYQLGIHGEKWLKFGVEHVHDANCPFCAQSVEGLTIVDAYKAYFSEAFGALIADRDLQIGHLKEVAVGGAADIKATIARNDADLTFWKTVCELPVTPTLSDSDQTEIASAIETLLELYQAKVANPLAPIALGASQQSIEKAFLLIEYYSQKIEACIAVIDAARIATAATDLDQAEQTLKQWQALQEKESVPIKTTAADYIKADDRRSAIEVEKKAAQTALTTYSAKTMSDRQTEVNSLLSDFGTNFRVVDAKASFVGREPNTEFAIAVGKSKIPVGEKSDTVPSFKTVLSAGDKFTLALAFFIAQVKADPSLKDAIVVFDDPFSSQDMNRQFETTSQIRSIADVACQTLVLSHDPRFLHMIELDAPNSYTATFQITCDDVGQGEILVWSSRLRTH
jgi:wobble nucleotide-excising tRNase